VRPALVAPSGRSCPDAPASEMRPAIATVRMPFGPFHRKALGHREHAVLAIDDGTVKARPVMVEVERIESTTPLCLPSIQRRPAASVQYIVPCSVGNEDRVGGAERQMFALRDEGRGRIVDEDSRSAPPARPNPIIASTARHHDIASRTPTLPPNSLRSLRGFVPAIRAAAANDQLGADSANRRPIVAAEPPSRRR